MKYKLATMKAAFDLVHELSTPGSWGTVGAAWGWGADPLARAFRTLARKRIRKIKMYIIYTKMLYSSLKVKMQRQMDIAN